MKKLLLVVLALLASTLWLYAGDQKTPDQASASEVKFQVVKADNGKPVRNAAVILHPVTKEGWQSRKGSELKTDAEGNSSIIVPYGKVRIQVIAPGFQTYGEDYVFSEPQRTIVIKLNRPSDQYSIYK
jgi:hypothetical protein